MGSLDFEQPLLEIEKNINELKSKADKENIDFSETIAKLEAEVIEKKKNLYRSLEPEQRLKIARHPNRPNMLDYVNHLFPDFVELHGDRLFGDDPAIVGGITELEGIPVVVIGQQKGRDTKEKLKRNFGTAHPEGYRKALRLLKMAETFKMPVLSFIDTPGAFPGITAEERGQASAIAVNLMEMISIKTPIIPVIIGEGGSGGALGIGIGDHIVMLEHAYYSVISPEGCAAILWKSGDKSPEAAKALKMTAKDLEGFKLIDEILEEPLGGAHKDPDQMIENMKACLLKNIKRLQVIPTDTLLKMRYEKFRIIGEFVENKKDK